MSEALHDALWPAAKAAGMRDKSDLPMIDLTGAVVDKAGKLDMPPRLFDRARSEKPHLFVRAPDMTPQQRAEFLRNHARVHGV